MIRKRTTYVLLAVFCFVSVRVSFSQQLPQYAQFNLNNLGLNPAYGGTHLGLEIWAGRRNQWIGFENAPTDTYTAVIYSFRRNYNYKAVHSVGGYVEQDKLGVFNNKLAHLYYALHMKISKGWKMGFGIFAGVRSIGITASAFNPSDPAFSIAKPTLVMYPDFVPGWRIYSKKMFIDISARNLYKNKLKQGDRRFGVESNLTPQLVFVYGHRFHSPTNDFVFTPAIKVQGNINSIPVVDLNFLTYYRKRIGFGVTYRPGISYAAMLQLRIKSNIMLGFAYEYTASRMRHSAPNSLEVMFGFSPVMSTDSERPTANRISACPEFDF